jgi:hypothetical protein
MPNRYYTAFPSLKISAKGARPSNPAGTTAAMPEQCGFTTMAMPGKTQSKDRGKGLKKVKQHACSKGI